jgi:hypothetical protein
MSFVKKYISLLTDSKYAELIKWVLFALNLVPIYIANYLRDHDFNGSSYVFVFSIFLSLLCLFSSFIYRKFVNKNSTRINVTFITSIGLLALWCIIILFIFIWM